MKKQILFLALFISSLTVNGQCVIDGTTLVGPGSKSTIYKACDVVVKSLTDGMVKSHGDSLKTATAGTDYCTPSSVHDSLVNYVLKRTGDVLFSFGTNSIGITPDNGAGAGGAMVIDNGQFLAGWNTAGFGNYIDVDNVGVTLSTNDTGSDVTVLSGGDVLLNVPSGHGVRMNSGGNDAIIKSDNVAGSDKTIQWPNASGVAVLNDNTAALTNKTYNGVTVTGSSSPSIVVTGTTTISGTHSGTSSGTNTGDQPQAQDTAMLKAFRVVCWGDSYTFGTGALSSTYGMSLANTLGLEIVNKGVGGETSSQILTRFNADAADWIYPTIIWSGRNNYTSPTQVKSDIASMIASLGHTNYIVLSVLNTNVSTEWIGQTNYTTITTLNSDLATLYGSHFLDVRAYLISQYNSGNSQDVIDHGHDVPPWTLRSRADSVHLNASGYAKVAAYIAANASGFVKPTINKVLTPNNLSAALSNSPNIGGVELATGYFKKFQIGSNANGLYSNLTSGSEILFVNSSGVALPVFQSSSGTSMQFGGNIIYSADSTYSLGTAANSAGFRPLNIYCANTITTAVQKATVAFRYGSTATAAPLEIAEAGVTSATVARFGTNSTTGRWDLVNAGSPTIRQVWKGHSGTTENIRLDPASTSFFNLVTAFGTSTAGSSWITLGANTTSKAGITFGSGSLTTSTNILAGQMQFLTDDFYLTISTGPAAKKIVLSDAGQTATRIPFATTNGRMSDDASLVYSTSTGITTTKNITAPHLIGQTSTPTIAAGAGAGTSPTVTITGTDLAGYISLTTGTLPTLSATVATITFNVAYGIAPRCVTLTPANTITAALSGLGMVYIDQSSITTTTAPLVAGATALTAAAAYKWFYQVVQ